VGYKVNDKVVERFPSSSALLSHCQPLYEELPGWQQSTSEVRNFEALPQPAKDYIKKIEQITSCPVALISVGQRREQTIIVRPIL
jgi:adenylosuccinate synthase